MATNLGPVEPFHFPVHSNELNCGQPAGCIFFESDVFQEFYDVEPFDLTHNLGSLDLFKPDYLTALADKFANAPKDFFIAASCAHSGHGVLLRHALRRPHPSPGAGRN